MKISIITACYNSENTIRDTLRSIREQTHNDIEHIIVDGGSSDKTLDIVNEYFCENTKIISEKDNGIYDAMNKGIGLATGDVIGFINSDDFYASPKVLHTVNKILSNIDYDGCYGDLCYVEKYNPNKIVRYWKSRQYYDGSFRLGWSPPHPTFFVKKNIYDLLGGFDLNFKLAADFELMARFMEVNKINTFYHSEVFVNMRLGGATNKNISNIIRQNIEIIAALSKYNLKISAKKLFFNKMITRLSQYLKRPFK